MDTDSEAPRPEGMPQRRRAPTGVRPGRDGIPPVVRKVLLLSLVASVAALGLLGAAHKLQNADLRGRSAEQDRAPATRAPATGASAPRMAIG